MSRLSSRALSGAVCAALVGAGLALAPTAAAADPWSAPAFERSIGARGNAGIYAWGIAHNPVTNEIIVSDYMNYQLRRYDINGTLLGSFYRPASQRRGHPESVAIDPRDGSIYTSDRSRDDKGYIAKFSKTGQFIAEYNIGASYHAWIDIDNDGYLYVSDSHVWHNETNPPMVKKYRIDNNTGGSTLMASWGTYGTGPGQIWQITGLKVADNGHVFAADTLNRTVHEWDANGTWIKDIGSGAEFDADLRGVEYDAASDTLFVADSQGGQIEKFNATTGASLGRFGSNGTGTGEFGDGPRQIALSGNGNLWIADFGNVRFHEYTPAGALVGTFPDPPLDPPAGSMSLPRDVAVDPASGDVWAVEQNNHRFQRFSSTGEPEAMFGRRSTDLPYGFNYPRGIGVDPATGRVWVANTNQDSVRVFNPDMSVAFTVGGVFGTGPGQFKNPMDIEFVGGKAYVADYAGQYLKVLDAATGTELMAINRPHSGVAVDPSNGDIYLCSWQTDKIWKYKADGTAGVPASFGARGNLPGQMQDAWDIDLVNGVLYTTDATRAKVIAYSTTGTFLGEFGSPGRRTGQFNNPSGITHDASGRIYVADAGNDRIQVFSAAPAPSDAAAPVVTITAPAGGSTVSAPVTISGTVSDDSRVGTVEIAIQDKVSRLWWDARVSTWSSTKQWAGVGQKGSSLTSQEWWTPFLGVAYSGQYLLQARSYDLSGHVSPVVSRTFSVQGAGPVDTVAPDTTITAPVTNSTQPAGSVSISGAASDSVGVSGVGVAVQNRTTLQWWNGATSTWQTAWYFNPAALSGSSTSPSWTWTFPQAAAGTTYLVTARATDSAGNIDSTRPSVRFTAQ